MTRLSPAQAEEQLRHLTQQFAQWRQSRTTPRGRIPKALWAQAVTLAQNFPCARVAQQLGLTPHALKRHREATGATPVPIGPPHAAPFVEVTPAWRSATTEVEVQRTDGARLRITYREPSPPLAVLLQTFLERC
jgi:hypothetical protein